MLYRQGGHSSAQGHLSFHCHELEAQHSHSIPLFYNSLAHTNTAAPLNVLHVCESTMLYNESQLGDYTCSFLRCSITPASG